MNVIETADILWEKLAEKAKNHYCRIVFPEGEDMRIIQAAGKLAFQKLVQPVLLGDPEIIKKNAAKIGVDMRNIEIIMPSANPDRNQYIDLLMEIRKHKQLSRDEAEQMVDDSLMHGCLMVKSNRVDGFVGGASRTTADTLRAGLTVLGVKKSLKTVSGAFIMHIPGSSYGNDGWFVFADCAVVPHPNAQQLADIAVASSKTFKIFLHDEPRVAFLSFSTKGSADDVCVNNIRKAVRLVKKSHPDLKVDGELQADAAIDMKVAEKKLKGSVSVVAGKANVLIFPDLNTGNIVYKLVQRLAGAQAVGPVLQGLDGAINDLSRGCTVDDIIKNVLITAVQAKGMA